MAGGFFKAVWARLPKLYKDFPIPEVEKLVEV